MQPFDPAAICAKCGSDQITARYCTESFYFSGNHPRHERHPAIHRHCQRCHYEWLEMPLDLSPVIEAKKVVDDAR